MRVATVIATMAVSMLICGLAGCSGEGVGGHGNSGVYTATTPNAAAMVQLIETPDHRVTGRFEVHHFGPDASIADDVLVIDGSASGNDLTLVFHPSWTTAGYSATARRDGDQLRLAQRAAVGTFKRSTMESFLRDEKIVSDHAAAIAAQRAQAAMTQAQRDAAQKARDDEVLRQNNALQNARDDEMNRQRAAQDKLSALQIELRNGSAEAAKEAAGLNHSRALIDLELHNAPERTTLAREALERARQTDAASAPAGGPLLEAIVVPLAKARRALGDLREFDESNSAKLAAEINFRSNINSKCLDAKAISSVYHDAGQISPACSTFIGEINSLDELRRNLHDKIEASIGPLQSEIDVQKALLSEARTFCARRRFC